MCQRVANKTHPSLKLIIVREKHPVPRHACEEKGDKLLHTFALFFVPTAELHTPRVCSENRET